MAITVSVYRRRYKVKRKDGRLVKRLAKTYTIEYRDAQGRLRRIPGYEDKLASDTKASKLKEALSRGEQGLLDPYAEHRRRPLSLHVADYLADLKAVGRSSKYVKNAGYRLNKLVAACGWTVLDDVRADTFCRWRETLARLEDGRTAIGPVTQNQYLEVARSFCGWAVKRERLASNPMHSVDKVDESCDIRRARRALTAEQVVAFLKVVDDPAHQQAYRFILSTGLRRDELAQLQWGDVKIDSPTPFLRLRAKTTKARRADSLPLRADTAGELRELRGDSQDSDKVFTDIPTMNEHRAYLVAAGIDWEDEQGRRADFHALRHTYGTLLSQSGASPREAMELMRHTDLRLTMKVYTDPRIFDLTSKVEALPIPLAGKQTQQASGTDDAMCVSMRVGNAELDVSRRMLEASLVSKTSANEASGVCQDTSSQSERVGIEPTSSRKAGRRRF